MVKITAIMVTMSRTSQITVSVVACSLLSSNPWRNDCGTVVFVLLTVPQKVIICTGPFSVISG